MAKLDWQKQLGVYTAKNQHQTSVPDPVRDLDSANKQYVDNKIQAIYPVGALYMSTLSTNPATLLGFGTWVAWGEGRMIVGRSSTDTDFDTAEETGGSKTSNALIAHTHTGPLHSHTGTTGGQSADHTHYINAYTTNNESGGYGLTSTAAFKNRVLVNASNGISSSGTSSNHTHSFTSDNSGNGDTGSAGSGSSFSIMNPYIVAYLWKRTA